MRKRWLELRAASPACSAPRHWGLIAAPAAGLQLTRVQEVCIF